MGEAGNCSLCGRKFGDKIEQHHLVPKTFGGKETIGLHPICHRTIHATFSERELIHYYNTIPRILENDVIAKFVAWVSRKEPDFYVSTRDSENRRNRRRR